MLLQALASDALRQGFTHIGRGTEELTPLRDIKNLKENKMAEKYKLMTRRATYYQKQDGATCVVCGKFASYWSQKEGKGGIPYGLSFNHCQTHREEGRALAENSTREDAIEQRKRIWARIDK